MQFILSLHGSPVSCDISACLSVKKKKTAEYRFGRGRRFMHVSIRATCTRSGRRHTPGQLLGRAQNYFITQRSYFVTASLEKRTNQRTDFLPSLLQDSRWSRGRWALRKTETCNSACVKRPARWHTRGCFCALRHSGSTCIKHQTHTERINFVYTVNPTPPWPTLVTSRK